MQANALTCEPASQMLSLLNGCLTTQAIHVAARLGIADKLRDGTRRIGDLSVALANKMARIAWALLAKGGTYRAPQLAAAV